MSDIMAEGKEVYHIAHYTVYAILKCQAGKRWSAVKCKNVILFFECLNRLNKSALQASGHRYINISVYKKEDIYFENFVGQLLIALWCFC